MPAIETCINGEQFILPMIPTGDILYHNSITTTKVITSQFTWDTGISDSVGTVNCTFFANIGYELKTTNTVYLSVVNFNTSDGGIAFRVFCNTSGGICTNRFQDFSITSGSNTVNMKATHTVYNAAPISSIVFRYWDAFTPLIHYLDVYIWR